MNKIRKIKINNKAKTTIMSTLIIIMLTLSVVSIVFIQQTPKVKADDPAWYNSNWTYRKSITIDNTKVNGSSDLTNFTIRVQVVGDSDIGGNVQSDMDDILFTDNSGNKLKHEVDNFSIDNGKLYANFWTKVPTLSHDADTIIWIYYGNAAATKQEDASNAWDDNYIAVWHFNSTFDSISGYNLTNNGATLVDGKIGKGYDFENGESDYMTSTSFYDISSCPSLTIEAYFWSESNTGQGGVFLGDQGDGGATEDLVYLHRSDSGYLQSRQFSNGDQNYVISSGAGVLDGRFHHGVCTIQDDYGIVLFVDGVNTTKDDTSAGTPSIAAIDDDLVNLGRTDEGAWAYYDGKLDEVRISNMVRSDEWINTTHNSIYENDNFITFGSQGEDTTATSSYEIKGLPDDIITFGGQQGSTVWSNSSGTDYETLEVNMSVIASDNVTELRVWVGDMNDTGEDITADNITLYVSSDNTSFGELDTFTSGGSNISINASTWNAGTMSDDPFAGAGITDCNASIYLRFKCTIDAAQAVDNYYSAAIDIWKIYIGHYT